MSDKEKILDFIKNKMKFYKWYPVESDIGYDTIVELYNERKIDETEFDSKELHIRKIDLDYKQIITESWYDKKSDN